MRGIVVAILTSVRESPELAVQYLQGTFPTQQVEDVPSAFRAMGNVIGQLVTIVNRLRQVPAWEPYLDQFIRKLATSGQADSV